MVTTTGGLRMEWHAETQSVATEQADMNLRGKFTTDAEGRFWFKTSLPLRMKETGKMDLIKPRTGRLFLLRERGQDSRPESRRVL